MATSDHVPEVCLQTSIFQVLAATLYFPFLKFIPIGFLEMRNEILIPSAVIPNAYYLGPMGDPDPSNFINQETN